jgi:NitT/TauT family transport system ATP-binding protein
LHVAYGDIRAIAGLDLEVSPGSFVALLGPSGGGKSTLLKVLAGLVPYQQGDIDVPAGGTSYVPQGNSCMPWLTAEGNVAYGLWVRGVGRRERQRAAHDLLHDLGLGGFAKKYPHQLSEGMRQRVAIARAFAYEAPVLLMDEPLSALDFQTRIQVQDELVRLWQARGCTVLYVTHDIDEALTLADRVVVCSARPATVAGALDVPLERPRSYRDIRQHPGYPAAFARLYELLEGQP